MKIILDNIIYSHVRQSGGVSNYWFELSKYLLSQKEDTVFFYEEREAELNFHRKQLFIPDTQLITNSNSSKSSIIRRLKPVKVDTKDHFLFHSSYYRSEQKAGQISQVTTVHDFTHDYYLGRIKRAFHNNMKYKAIRKSEGIICISESTYNDLYKFCPPRKDQKVAIIHNGAGKDYFMTDRSANAYIDSLHIENPYLLYVGSRTHYKNFSFVAKLLNESPGLNLVVVGLPLLAAETKLFTADALKRIVIVSGISDSELNLLYNYAHAFIYPSSYEGFGIPIIEAMRAGCPVLALRNSSIIEVAGNAGILFDKMHVPDFKAALTKLHQPDFRQDIIEKGLVHSQQFSWEKCCRETHEFYKEVY